MKIALVHRRFTTHGGTERYLVGFARWLVAHGHDVHVLCNEVREDLRGEPGVHFEHLSMLRPAKLVSLWVSASRALRRASYDAVMGFGRTPGHQLFRAGGGSHVEALRRMHPLRRWISPADWVEMRMDRAAIRTARICIANSALGARGLVADYGAARVEVVYNGVDLARFRPDPQARAAVRSELGAQGPTALFLGTGFTRKGLDVAIDALPPGWTLWVAGKDRPWKAPACVRFLGPWRDPERLLQAADVMILPTRYDPFANACLEALASGIPTLTTPSNGAAEVLPHSWMVATDAAGFRAGLLAAEAGGRDLRDACRATAERFTTETSYARAFVLLQEASR
ncbi:MAG: glycosyltransferase family 4 protein [Pseudomonadota bacterium]|nr:glycosyltransferase family 4 protein [Pseudomonadota bacterium]